MLCVVLRGALALESDDAGAPRLRAGPGDTLGLFEALAGTVTGAVGRDPLRLTVTEPGTALQIAREDLFDLIGQRPAASGQRCSSISSVSSWRADSRSVAARTPVDRLAAS